MIKTSLYNTSRRADALVVSETERLCMTMYFSVGYESAILEITSVTLIRQIPQ
jgi:hypothetical protein